MEKTIYIDFLDYYTLERARRSWVPYRHITSEGARAIRLSILLADRVILPASSFFESELCREILRQNMLLTELGLLYVSAAEPSLVEHREAKLSQYDADSAEVIVSGYSVKRRQVAPPYLRRSGSSMAGIRKAWTTVLDQDALPKILGTDAVGLYPGRLESLWSDVPDRLEGRAFVTNHALKIFEREGILLPYLSVAPLIESTYITGYLGAFNAQVVADMIYLRTLMRPMSHQRAFSYARVSQCLAGLGLLDLVDHAPPEALLGVRLAEEWEVLRTWLTSAAPRISADVAHAAEAVNVLSQKIPAASRWSSSGIAKKQTPGCKALEGPSIGVITALPEEFVAAKCAIEEPTLIAVSGDNNTYVRGVIPSTYSRPHVHQVVLTQLKRMGTNSAASSAEALLRSFPSVRVIIMVGIACAVPSPRNASQHVRLGDAVISDRQGIVQFDHVTRSNGQVYLRDVLPPPAAGLTVALNRLEGGALEGTRPWDAHLDAIVSVLPDFRRPTTGDDLLDAQGNRVRHPRDSERARGRPRLFRGVIGSSNTLIRDQEFRDWVRDTYKVRAIEMEASGIAEAAWHHEQHYFVIRGTCDYGDSQKNDKWHRYAAAVAAAFMRSLIEESSPYD